MNVAWRELALVAVGGSIGAVGRYLVGKAMGPTADAAFPWHTLVVNLSGAFVLGLVIVVAARSGAPGWWRPLVAVGVLGGYTTFSTFSVEVVQLLMTGRPFAAVAYATGSVVAGVAGAFAGILLGRAVA